MKIKLKYSLGDKFVDKVSGKEYTIDKWKVVKTAEGIVNAYTFHAYCDSLFEYHEYLEEDKITEKGSKYGWPDYKRKEYQLECAEPHECEVEVSELDRNGEKVEIGDTVYGCVLSWTLNDDGTDGVTTDARLTFAYWGTVDALIFMQERLHNSDHTYGLGRIYTDVSIWREGPCYDTNGKPYHDARTPNQVYPHTQNIRGVFKTVQDWFVDLYVAKVRSMPFEKKRLLTNDDYVHDCVQVLKHMGIYDRVIDMVKKNTRPKKKPSSKPKKKPEVKKVVDWEALARKLAAQSGVDIDEMTKS
jgi:hypothetical protein